MMRGYAGKIWLITAAGLAARLALIGYQPLWRDEAFTALAVQRPLGPMLDVVRNDSAPPLFYLVERLFAVVSTGPAMLRLLPVLAGIAAIPIIAALGRWVAGDAGGIWAALIAAIAPALVVSSLDARMYMLATTLVLASTLCLLRALEQPSALRWTLYATCAILAVYTVYFALFAVLAQVISVAVLYRRARSRSVLTVAGLGVLTVVSLVPWVVVARAQLSHTAGAFWVPKLGAVSLLGGLEQFFTGPPVNTWVTGFAAVRALELAGDVAGVLLFVALILNRRRLAPDGAATAVFLALAGGAGVAVMILVSLAHPLEDGRYLSSAWAVLYPLLGASLAVLPLRRVAWGAAAVTAAASTVTLLVITNPNTPAAVASLETRAGPHDVIAAYPSEYLLVLYYGDASIDERTRSIASSIPWFWGTAVYPPGATLTAMPAASGSAGPAVWYVSQPGDPSPPDASAYTARSRDCWSGVCVTMLSPSGLNASGGHSNQLTGQENAP